jgi:serine phosphatase RsbU (regulator of sigma subunit)
MSLFLSYNFSRINKDLEFQLAKVKELSEKTIEQERLTNRLETERRIVDAENERKTIELENARKLQISLLPKKIPESENLDISFFMNTASEVGGDYYDIITGDDGNMLLAIGDATGHGVSAGIIVSIVKVLIYELNRGIPVAKLLDKINDSLMSMNISNNYMGLTLLKINESQVELSSAGMPPIFFYKQNVKKIEPLVFKRMPLGATNRMRFETIILNLNPGDILLLFSDGLSEMFNAEREMFDYHRIKQILGNHSQKSSSEIIADLKSATDDWRAGTEQFDDMTIIAIKYKDQN